MNPVFIMLVIIGALTVWALLNVAFPIIGEICIDWYRDIKNSLNKKEKFEL